MIHLEGAEAIDPGLEALDLWYAAGLRSLGPVWSRANAFAHGVPFVFPSTPDIGPGLTDAGRALARRCAELGILVDVSHLNEAGFWDLAGLELGPIVATHSAAHALSAASRNLTDAQLDAIGASGGLVGIVFASSFLRPDFADDEDTPLELIAEHARYVADRIGVGARRARLGLRRCDDARRARWRLGNPEAARGARRGRVRGARAGGDRLGQLAPRAGGVVGRLAPAGGG